MKVYYDLNRAPPTYDFVSFLCGIELDHRGPFELIIVPGKHDGFRKDGLWPHNTGERSAMLERVVVPLARLLPSVRSVDVEAFAHPPRPRYGIRPMLRAFRHGIRPLRADPLPSPGAYVTITLREAEHWPNRNSQTSEWMEAAHRIEGLGLRVIFIRDSLMAGWDVPGFTTDHKAATDVSHRARLYAGARLNMGVNNGPMWLAAAMDTPVAVLKMIARSPTTTDAYFRRSGLTVGERHPWGAPHQTLTWADDTRDAVLAAFLSHA